MLNQQEKRIMQTMILPQIKKIKKIAYDPEKIYKTDKYIDYKTDGKTGLWVGFSDIYDLINNVEKILEKMAHDDFAKKETGEQTMKRIERKHDKIFEIEQKAREEGSKQVLDFMKLRKEATKKR